MSDEMLKISAMVRSALMVEDLARSTDFYTKVLGISQVYWEGTLKGQSVERLLGVPEGSVCKARILTPTPENMGMVGLFELSQPKPQRVQKRDDTSQIGEAFLVFYASDLDEVMHRLDAGNHTVLYPPIALEHEGQVKQREMGCLDPDGFKINLIEWDPAADKRPELTLDQLS
ncbi:MAG: VOC family protein [Pseudomonadota bacterium]